ncbi:aldo-keto reductase family 1 member A1 isoform X1 [Hydra vulgaris]|uniref:Alcohol dehydrogenase [NADP+] n=1 Tax=Hydra vulgaris TaxID=6087 RepID=T2MGX4_HYDVU|nr:aldo-keto reductase family 1 member A1 [Hydra vulgaris]
MVSSVSNVKITLANGYEVPVLGLGTWKSSPGIVGAAIEAAIDLGYRHIDCAAIYGNEKEIGDALKKKINEGVVKREELFITSKLWNTRHAIDLVRPSLLQTLADLQLDYLDLYLIHWPHAFKSGDEKFPRDKDGNLLYDDVHYNDTWKEMEKAVDDGLVKSIGLSNFNSQQIDDVCTHARVMPQMLQVECHPYLTQELLIKHCSAKSITVTGYSPLGSKDRPWAKPEDPLVIEDPEITKLAEKYNKSNAQILIRWQLQRGQCVIPKSANPQRIKENSEVFDFELSNEEIVLINSLNKGWRCCLPMIEVNGKSVERDAHHPLYPYNIPY